MVSSNWSLASRKLNIIHICFDKKSYGAKRIKTAAFGAHGMKNNRAAASSSVAWGRHSSDLTERNASKFAL